MGGFKAIEVRKLKEKFEDVDETKKLSSFCGGNFQTWERKLEKLQGVSRKYACWGLVGGDLKDEVQEYFSRGSWIAERGLEEKRG